MVTGINMMNNVSYLSDISRRFETKKQEKDLTKTGGEGGGSG